MKAMILAAGRGRRMGHLTDHTPKPLLELAGKPLLQWHLEALARQGFREVVINTAYRGQQIVDYLGSGERFGLEIRYSREEGLAAEGALGTAGAIVQALPLLGTEPFLLINGDVCCPLDFNAFAAAGRAALARGADGFLLMVANPPWKERGDFSLANGLIIPGTQLTFGGISLFRPQLFFDLSPGFRPLLEIFHRAMKENKLAGLQHQGLWEDVGTPARLAAMNETFARMANS